MPLRHARDGAGRNCGRLARRPSPAGGANLVGLLAILELLLALAAVLSMWLIGHAGTVFAWAGPLFTGTPVAYMGPMAVTSIVAILPPALLMGMAFPIGVSLWVSSVDNEQAGQRVGVYAVNVAGAVAGRS
jgi:hypothetical protein